MSYLSDDVVDQPTITWRKLPDTVARLLKIRPGETFPYYRGNFDSDIARSTFSAVAYGNLLRIIRNTAIELEAKGRVTLSEGYIELPRPNFLRGNPSLPVWVTVYTATGIEARDAA